MRELPDYSSLYRERDACGIGAVVNIDGRKTYEVLDDALSIVEKLEHRAGKDATGKVGDGVGILAQISHDFFKKAVQGDPAGSGGESKESSAGKKLESGAGKKLESSAGKKLESSVGIQLGDAGDYGIGMFFLPQDKMKRTFAMRMFEVIAEKEGLEVLGWRQVPTHPEILGQVAVDCMPDIRQVFLKRPESVERGLAFDRRLYVV
ncbi:MAG: hypothetical protein IJ794_16155, partial [Lachnospiraceae bacterium]|nr:hypothetical protein [Lachnospiraceae bacterium]